METFGYLIAQVDVPKKDELLLTTAVPLFFGLVLFFGLLRGELDGVKPWVKWLGAIPLAIGAYLGWPSFAKITDSTYQQAYGAGLSRSYTFLHYAGFVLNLGALVAIIVVGILVQRRRTLEY